MNRTIVSRALAKHRALLAAHGLTATYVPSTDLQVEDSTIELSVASSGLPTGYAVQVSLYGGYYVNHYTGEGDDFRMRDCGGFRTLASALKHAVTLATRRAA